jgi:hypothetical protein
VSLEAGAASGFSGKPDGLVGGTITGGAGETEGWTVGCGLKSPALRCEEIDSRRRRIVPMR